MKQKLSASKIYTAIMFGGAAGASLRYLMLYLFADIPDREPWIILVENISGSFFLGLLTGFVISKKIKEWPWLYLFGTGLLGSFTTFSTLALDVIYLLESSLILTLSYIIFSLSGGLFMAFLGLYLGKGGKS